MSIRSLLTIACLLVTSIAAAQDSYAPKKFAVLIGINNYAEPLSDLAYARNDVQALHAQLLKAGFDKDRICYVSDTNQDPALLPTHNNILRQLRLTLEEAEEHDLVLVAFSGHGVQIDGDSYLCPFDADITNRERAAIGMVAVKDIYESMEQSKAGQKLLIVDACRNELAKGIKAAAQPKSAVFLDPPKGVQVLTSCREGEFSWEDNGLEHGIFMNYVVEGLAGAADVVGEGNGNGRVALDELYTYASQRTTNHAREKFTKPQHPTRFGVQDGLWEIATVDRNAVGTASIAKPLPQAVPVAEPPSGQALAKDPLMAQAQQYCESKDYKKAIDAYSRVLSRSGLSPEIRQEAYSRRGYCHYQTKSADGVHLAIMDKLEAGEPGLRCPIVAKTVSVNVGNKNVGTLEGNDSVLVTRVQKFGNVDYLWVTARGEISLSPANQGWIKLAAVIEQPKAPVDQTAVVAPATAVQPKRVQTNKPSSQSSGNSRSYNNNDSGSDFSNNYQKRNGRPPSIWETPEWESPAEVRELRRQGKVR